MENTLKKPSKFFNGKLFVQGLLRIKTIAIVSLVCSLIYCIAAPLINSMQSIDNTDSQYVVIGHSLINISAFFLPLTIIVYIAAPVMTIMIFSFLRSRSGSDFFHSSPVKKSVMFLSLVTSVIAWIAAIIAFFTLAFIISVTFILPSYEFLFSYVMIYDIQLLIAALFIIFVTCIGCFLTSTVFSGILISAILIFGPSTITFLLFNVITSTNYVFSYDSFAGFLNNCTPIPSQKFLIFLSEFRGNSSSANLFGALKLDFSVLNTLIMSCILFALALFAFNKRPSEATHKTFSYKWVKITVILLITYGASLLCVSLIALGYIQEKELYLFNPEIIILIAFSLIVVFIIDVILSKSIKKVIKDLVAIPLVIIVDVITFLCLINANEYMGNYQFDIDDIDSISLSGFYINIDNENDSSNYESEDEYYYYDDLSHFYKNLNNYVITDKEVIKTALTILNSRSKTKYPQGLKNYPMTIHKASGDVIVNFYISNKEYKNLYTLLASDSNRKATLLDTPKKYVLNCLTDANLPYEQVVSLFETYTDEIANFSNGQHENWIDFLNCYHRDEASTDTLNSFDVQYYYNGIYTTTYFPISNITPKTYAKYIKTINDNAKEKILNILDEMDSNDSIQRNIYLRGCDINGKGTLYPDSVRMYSGTFNNKLSEVLGIKDYFVNDKYTLNYNFDWSICDLYDITLQIQDPTDASNYIGVNFYMSLLKDNVNMLNLDSYLQEHTDDTTDIYINYLELNDDSTATQELLSEGQANELFQSLKNELDNMDTGECYNYLASTYSYGNDASFFDYIYVDSPSIETLLGIPITPECHDSYSMFMRMVNDHNRQKAIKLLELMNSDPTPEDHENYMMLNVCNDEIIKSVYTDGLSYKILNPVPQSELVNKCIDFLESDECLNIADYDKSKYILCEVELLLTTDLVSDSNYEDSASCFVLLPIDINLLDGQACSYSGSPHYCY